MHPGSDEESPTVFGEYSRFYDLLYAEKTYDAEVGYVDGILRRHGSEVRSILELGSGTGIHASLLAARGYSVHGVERSARMLATARARFPAGLGAEGSDAQASVTFTEGDIRKVRLHRSFDAAVALFHVMSYQRSNEDLDGSFATARAHLESGGLLVFDAWYGPAVLTEGPSVRRKRVESGPVHVTRWCEPRLLENENVVEVVYDIVVADRGTGQLLEFRERHDMRYLFQPEVAMLADRHGFSLVAAEEWLTGAPLGRGTWGACFILRAD